MTATLNVYESMVLTGGGLVEPFGNLDSAINGGVTLTSSLFRRQPIGINAGTKKTIFDFTDLSLHLFSMMHLQIIGDGTLNLAIRYDSIASGSPTGLARYWTHHNLKNFASFNITDRTGYTHVTPATCAGDTAGEPSLWAATDKAVGVIDKVMVWNQHATDSVTLGVFMTGGG